MTRYISLSLLSAVCLLSFWLSARGDGPATATAPASSPSTSASTQAAGLPEGVNPVLWLKADAGLTVSDDGKVSAWADQSGKGNDTTATDPSKSPKLVKEAIGKHPALEFESSQLDLKNPIKSDAITIFAVVKVNVGLSIRTIVGGSNGSLQYRIGGDANDLKQQVLKQQAKNLGHGTTDLAVDTFNVIDVSLDKEGGAFRIDGQDDGTCEGSEFTDSIKQVGLTNETEFFDGQIAELIIVPAKLSAPQIAGVEKYLKDKYGLNKP